LSFKVMSVDLIIYIQRCNVTNCLPQAIVQII
jgi:hypothetical protein